MGGILLGGCALSVNRIVYLFRRGSGNLDGSRNNCKYVSKIRSLDSSWCEFFIVTTSSSTISPPNLMDFQSPLKDVFMVLRMDLPAIGLVDLVNLKYIVCIFLLCTSLNIDSLSMLRIMSMLNSVQLYD